MSWSLIMFILVWAIRLVMLPVVVMRKEKPVTCLAWLAVIFLEPRIGLLLYLLVGENRLGRRRLVRRLHHQSVLAARRMRPDQAGAPIALDGDCAILASLARRIGGLPMVGGNEVSLSSDTDAAIDRLVGGIDSAVHNVHLLFYIFRDDQIGRRVADALIRAQHRGVTCRVLADATGSWGMLRTLAPKMRQQGVRVVQMLTVNPFRRRLARLDLRNHRKLAIIDGSTAFTGSQNIVEAEFGHRRAGAWQDIVGFIRGPVVRQLQMIFIEDWFYETDEILDESHLYCDDTAAGAAAVQVVPTGPYETSEELKDLFVQAVYLARREVIITSPYFIPDETLLLAFRLATARGVRVDIIIPRRSDHPIVDAAGRHYCQQVMRYGVNVYRYRSGMLHAKSLTVDDELAMFGTANLDVRSFGLNFELNLLLRDPRVVSQLRDLQVAYRALSDRAAEGEWPSRKFHRRLVRNLAKILSPLL